MKSNDELRSIAEEIIIEHATNVEFSTIWERYETLGQDELEEVDYLIGQANVRVYWTS